MSNLERDLAARKLRVDDRMFTLVAQFPTVPVANLRSIAEYEDQVIYGKPGTPTPRGLLAFKDAAKD